MMISVMILVQTLFQSSSPMKWP